MVDIFKRCQIIGKKINKKPVGYFQSESCANINNSNVDWQKEMDKRDVKEIDSIGHKN